MNELYWITRFSYFHSLAMIFMIIGFLGTAILIIAYYIHNGQTIYEESRGREEYANEYRGYKNICLKSLRWSVPITIMATLMFLFIPTTKEALIIYGVGGTVDYLKENPTAKQLPNKCIEALDKWVDTWNAENKKEKE
jgi:hypothetical protein